MNRNIILLIPFLILIQTCEQNETIPISFNPTDFIISKMGWLMRFTVDIPSGNVYSFSSDSSVLNASGELFHEFLVQKDEMENLAINLSDTIIFKWEITTEVFPYPEDDCKLRVCRSGYGDFMCSIGKGNSASSIIQALSKSLTGEPKEALAEIIMLLSD